MTDQKAKMHELFEEAMSPEAEVINFNALHDLLEAQIDYLSDETMSGTASTAHSNRASMVGAHLSDQKSIEIPPKISESQTGWITKATCCEDLNKKLFGTQNDLMTTSQITSHMPKGEVGELSGLVETLDEKLDDFVSDTSRRVSKIHKRVKKLEHKPKKIEWDQRL